jgi:hypothetical protein
MGKLRKKKCTVYGIVEDQIEFIEYLNEIYQTDINGINFKYENANGGYPDRILGFAINECHRDRSFAWFDEDFEPHNPISKEARTKLAKYWKIEEKNIEDFLKCPLSEIQNKYNSSNRKPVIIISQPVCSESLIIQALGETIPESCKIYNPNKIERDKQIKGLKDKLKKIIGKENKLDYFRTKLTKEILEERKKSIPSLDLLILMITP